MAFKKYIKWFIRNLGEIAFLLMITSALMAVLSIFSNEAQDYLFWAWSLLFLASSFILHRYSMMVKSSRCFLLSLFEILFIIIVSAHYCFGIQLLPQQLSGMPICILLLMYYAVSLCFIIPGGKKQGWTKVQKTAMTVSLGVSVLSAVLAIFIPKWAVILMLNVATAVSVLFIRDKRRDVRNQFS